MPGQQGQGQYPPGMPMGQYYKVCNLLYKCQAIICQLSIHNLTWGEAAAYPSMHSVKSRGRKVIFVALSLNAAHSLKNNCMVCAFGCKDLFQIVIVFCFLYSKSPSMVKAPTFLVVDTPTAKEMGYVFTSYPKEKVLYFNLCQDL